MKKILSVAVAASFLVLTGCNTVAGLGKDVEKVGDKTQEVSKDASTAIKKKE